MIYFVEGSGTLDVGGAPVASVTGSLAFVPSTGNGSLASPRGRALGSVVVAARRWFERDHPDLHGVHLDAVGVGSGDVGEVVEADVISVIDLNERFTDRPVDMPYAGGLSEAPRPPVQTLMAPGMRNGWLDTYLPIFVAPASSISTAARSVWYVGSTNSAETAGNAVTMPRGATPIAVAVGIRACVVAACE